MRLIGMLDSPFVRRTAISLARMEVPFTLDQLSVFSDFDQIAQVNPSVKVPTLVTDYGVTLMDSSLIIEYVRLTCNRPVAIDDTGAYAVRALGLGLVASEKTLHVIYERSLRPDEKVHGPWLERVEKQLRSTYAELEKTYAGVFGVAEKVGHADVMAAVAWRFTRANLPDLVAASDHPALSSLSERMEATPEFMAYPYPE